MATRPTSQSSYRSGNSFSNGTGSGSVDVGANAVTRMAREDTRWFVAGVVVLSIVLFLALPLSVLVVVDHLKVRAEIRAEVREMRKLRSNIEKERNERVNPTVDQSSKAN